MSACASRGWDMVTARCTQWIRRAAQAAAKLHCPVIPSRSSSNEAEIARSSTRYVLEGAIVTAPRARTGLFVPMESTLYVAAPAAASAPARVLVYHTR
jgi:hypothetical protein